MSFRKITLLLVVLIGLLVLPADVSSAFPLAQAETITARSTHVIGLDGARSYTVRPGDWITYRGDFVADITTPQSADFSFNVTSLCGLYYTVKFTVPEVKPGTQFILAPGYFQVPNEVCGGRYSVTFGVTYNATSWVTSWFTMIGVPTPTATMTRKPGSVTALSTWTEKTIHNLPVYVFSPGDVMRFGAELLNGEGSSSTTTLEWSAVGPCGLLHSVKETWGPEEPFPGIWDTASAPFTIPPDACAGNYTNTLKVTYNGTTTAESTFTIISSVTPTKTATPTRTRTATPTATFTPDGNWIYCARENATCTLPGTRLTRFGANGKYLYKTLTSSFACKASTFGSDPAPGVVKACHYNSDPNAPTPTFTPTQTRVYTKTRTPTFTATRTNTATLTPTATPTLTGTPTEPIACQQAPEQPRLVEPKANALIEGQTMLRWRAAECAELYRVVIREKETKQQVEAEGGLTTLEFSTSKLEPAHSYQWRVIAVNLYGRTASKWRELHTK